MSLNVDILQDLFPRAGGGFLLGSCPGWKGPIAMTVTPLAKDFWGFFLPRVINMLGHHLLWVQGLV